MPVKVYANLTVNGDIGALPLSYSAVKVTEQPWRRGEVNLTVMGPGVPVVWT